jgi:NADP-dependent 3-hydroxy acid dehydrogenase YdfG
MKVAITAHTTGIGAAIADAFTVRHHDIIGMSRATGYTLPEDRQRVLDDSKDCDIFVNVWYQRNTDFQIKLLYDFFNMWKGQNKHIISIGSRAGECYILGEASQYSMFKHAHDAACQQLFNRRDQRPKVTNIRPGYVDTESVKSVSDPKLSCQDVADAVMYAVTAPYYISQVTLAKQKFG